MKERITKTLAAAALIAGLAASAVAPWWAVWFICFPAAWSGAVVLLKKSEYV